MAYALPFPWFIPRALLLLLGEFLAAPANLAAAPATMIASCLALPLALAVVRPSEARSQQNGDQGADGKGSGPAGRAPYRAEFRRKGRGFGAKLVGVHPRDLTDEDREAFVRVLRKNLAAKGLGEEVRVALAMHEGCIQLNARYWVLGPNNELTVRGEGNGLVGLDCVLCFVSRRRVLLTGTRGCLKSCIHRPRCPSSSPLPHLNSRWTSASTCPR